MKLSHENWTLDHFHSHLQAAVDLEFWTIPFYMSTMYSIKDRGDSAYQLIRTIINQEMLHLQCAANMANAYGLSPSMKAPIYEGTTIPHLDFGLDNPEKIEPYLPYTAEIGSLDLEHVNAMCLVEIPDYDTGKRNASPQNVTLHSEIRDYGSIGAFYSALRMGASLLRSHIKGGLRQVDYFSAFYRNAPSLVISEFQDDGFNQVELLIDLITDQGEGACKEEQDIPKVFQNTADDIEPAEDHFTKFNQIKGVCGKGVGQLPDTYQGKPRSSYSEEDRKLEEILIDQFTELRGRMEGLFRGENPKDFFPIMASVGGAIRNCWEHGVTPKYSRNPNL